MISIENLNKSYGAQVLFDNVGFKLNAKERVGLVGRNGHGKTTLFRIITGEEETDLGTLIAPKNYRIGYVRQHLSFSADTVLGEGMTDLPPQEKDHHWKVEKILAGLGFSTADMQRHPNEFSGGYQVRLNLAKVLVSEPDLLLLDEPTNYLDITSIRWIERFLLTWPHELILITHDRGFMDKIVTHVLGIHRQKLRKITGTTDKYYQQVAQDEEIYEKTRLNDERKRKEVELFISRFRAKARLANLVQSRVKALEKAEKKEKLVGLKDLEFSFQYKPLRAKQVLSVSDLSFGYHKDNALIRKLNCSVTAGDRVCVVGKNGKGKTTLLKLLAGTLAPWEGDIIYHPQIDRGVYEQTNIQSLVDSRSVAEEILYSHPATDQQAARNICGGMMFEGDSALKKISVLSGGEKSRVLLGKLLVTPVNLLLLDEPTNHLDMDSCDALLSAIDNFEGTVIMVTHNEMFLHVLATRLIVFHDDEVMVFDGNYQDFLDKVGWQDDPGAKSQPLTVEASQQPARLTKKMMRKQRSEIVAERSKVLKPIETAIAAAEAKIHSRETELDTLNRAMVDASRDKDGPRIGELSQQIHTCQTIIDEQFKKLETLYDQFEEKDERFKRMLGDLE
ncbi:MAG: ABC-F family ATP-binding cassette domain-containing protein [Desulfobacteraceae bacterium]|nr:ABC-F family ATP-binding cassette domain-containing protein [Desulfobacteraceae bacterium]